MGKHRHERADALTEVLQTVALCVAIVVLIMVGALIDRSGEVEDAQLAAQAEQRQQEARAARVQALREAFEAGLDEGLERARWLAAQEARP
ncbi:MAG: hypothetical protein AMXMBFR78_34170 [Rubrivivax sp.]